MSYSMTDPSGGYFDPNTGMYVPASAMPTKQQALAPNPITDVPAAAAKALFPALSGQPGAQGPTGPQAAPAAPPQAPPPPPQQAPVAAAMGAPAAPPPQPPAPVAQALQQPPVAGRAATMVPPQASSPTGAVGAPSSDYYATAQPPQDPTQSAIVQAAAAKYGVPPQVANWVGYHESGWNAGANNPSSGTQGAWQFKPATAQQYGVHPTDFTSSTDGAMRYLSDLAKKNGGDWTQAVQQYGTFSTGLGSDRDTAAKAGFQKFMGGAPGPTLAGTTTQPQAGPDEAQQPGQTMTPGTGLGNIQALLDAAGVKPVSRADKLVALASGLFSGKTFGDSMGKGLGNLTNLNQEDRQQAMQLANVGIQQQYHDALLGVSGQRVGIQQQNANIHQQTANQGGDRNSIMRDRINAQYSPTTQAALADAKTSGKTSATSVDALFNQTPSDTQALQEISDAQNTIQQHPELMGPTMKAQAVRFLNRQGVDGDPADQDFLNKSFTDQRNQMLSALTGGHVGGIRSDAELRNISKAVADTATSPAAAQYIVGLQKAQIQARQAWREQLQSLHQNGQELPVGHDYSMQQNEFYNRYLQQNPLPSYSSAGGAAPQGGSPAPGVTPQGGTKGVAPTMRYDQASGQMVPM